MEVRFLCHRGHNSCSSFIFATFQSNTVTVFFAMPKMRFKMSSADGVCYKIIMSNDCTDKVSKDANRQGPDQTARVI